MTVSRAVGRVRFGLAAVCLSVALVVVSGVAFTRGGGSGPGTPEGRGPVSSSDVAPTGDMAGSIASLQSRLKRLPGDYDAWASLGTAYVQQARITGDPSYYAKAAGVLRRSLDVKPSDNPAAVTGQAALAAARHDFARALRLTNKSLAVNAYSSATMAILVDSLVELGRYQDATKALQRFVDVKPGVPAFTRVSYNYELHGNLAGARFAMQRALATAYSSDDRAFALFELGELAWNNGELAHAHALYRKGWAADHDYVANLYGLAKADAGLGDEQRAVQRYQRLVDRLPQPTYVIEYADLLTSLGRTARAAEQHTLIAAQERLFRSAGVNLDLELALYDASHGRPARALEEARAAWQDRRSVFVEDAYAWALHVNGRDAPAREHVVHAQRLGTRSALFAFHRGMIDRSLGRRAAGERWLERALAINPAFNPILAEQAREVLAP
jgi:tetratricopeptide (TPR) repeat protein